MNEHEKSGVLEMVLERYETARRWRYEKEAVWVRMFEMYRGLRANGQDGVRHNIFVPESFTIIETLLPRLAGQYLDEAEKIYKVRGREPGDEDNARSANLLIQYQAEQMQFAIALIPFLKQCLIYGTAVAKIFWKLDEREKTLLQRQQFTFGAGQTLNIMEPSTGRFTLYDGPVFEPVDLFDFFIEPNARDLQSAEWCIHRKFVKKYELEAMAALGVYRGLESLDEPDDKEPDDRQKEILRIEGITETKLSRVYELLEYWEDGRVIAVLDGERVIRDEENPFAHGRKPFVAARFTDVPFQFYGIGALEPMRDLQEELNERRSQRLDYYERILNPMWLAQRGMVDDPGELVSKPGGVILCNDINGIRTLPIESSVAFAEAEEEHLRNEIQNATGVTDIVIGGSTPRATATEISVKAQGSFSRFDFVLKKIARVTIREVWQFVIELDQQMLDKALIVRVLGPEGEGLQEIQPWEIAGDFDLVVEIDPEGQNREIKRQQLLNLYNLFGADPQVNGIALKRMILEAFDIKNINEILSPQASPQAAMPVPPGGGAPPEAQPAGMPPGMHAMPDGTMMPDSAMAGMMGGMGGMQTVVPQGEIPNNPPDMAGMMRGAMPPGMGGA